MRAFLAAAAIASLLASFGAPARADYANDYCGVIVRINTLACLEEGAGSGTEVFLARTQIGYCEPCTAEISA